MILDKTEVTMGKTTIVARFGIQSLVVLLVIIPYLYILNYAVFPWMLHSYTYSSGVFHSMLATVLTLLILISYILVSTTNPGDFQDTLSPSYYLIYPISSSQQEDKRYCSKCKEQKPERAHHCSNCKKCVLRMDHHCIFINNCVGVFNHKYFILFLFYLSISIIYFFYLLITRSTELWAQQQDYEKYQTIDVSFILITGSITIALAITEISVTSMLFTNIWLLARNITTIEHEDMKRKRASATRKLLPHQSQHQFQELLKKYDKGSTLNNFAEIFGPFSFNWFLPIPPTILKNNYNRKGDIMEV